jgi:hypothetical protein
VPVAYELLVPGSVVGGGILSASNATANNYGGNTPVTLAGSWRLMGRTHSISSDYGGNGTTLWLRIS